MANLETLELTINANAQSASQGISTLISSLGSLSSALTKPYGDLQNFNAELKKMKEYCAAIKLPNIGKVTGGKAAVGKAKNTMAQNGVYDPRTGNGTAVSNAAGVNPAMTRSQAMGYADKQAFEEATRQLRAMEERAKESYLRQFEERKQQLIAERKFAGVRTEDGKFIPHKYKETAEAAKDAAKGTRELGKATEEASESGKGLSGLKSAFKSLTKGVSGFFGRIKRIATTMLIRSAIRALIKDIREGVNNLYEWSKLNKGEFASSLDTLKNKAGTLKNSIGAALSPVIQAIIPILNNIADAAVNAFNWVNQLFSLLTGKSYWTKATDGVHDYTEAAKGAGGATKDWLAAFDELNVMNQAGGGGGGSSSTTDYSDMFENVTVFDEKIRGIANFLKDNVENIKTLAIEVGAAILGWKLSKAFAETIPELSKMFGYLSTGAVIALTLTATWMFSNEYLKTGESGWLLADALTSAVGATAAWAIAKKLIGGSAGTYAAAITLALSAVTGIVANVQNTDVSALSSESIQHSVIDALKGGAAAGIIAVAAGATGGWALVAIGAAALLTFAVELGLKLYTERDKMLWGDVSLTTEQIQSYVSSQLFTVSPKVVCNLISSNVELGQTQRSQIESKLQAMLGTFNVVRLGLNDSTTLATLRTQTEELITQAQTYITNAKETGKLTLQFVPVLAGENSDSWYKNYISGWDKVNEWYSAKGKELGSILVENEKGEIVLKSPELLQTLMSELTEVTNAISRSKVLSNATSNFRLGLGDMTKATGQQVIDLFKQYKTDLTDGYTDLVNEQYEKQGELVAALGAIDPNSEEYKQAVAEYKRMGENLQKAVEEGVNSNLEPGKNIVLEWLFGNHEKGGVDSLPSLYYYQLQNLFNNNDVDLSDVLHQALKQAGFTKEEIEALDIIEVSGWEFFSEDMKKNMIGWLKITVKNVKSAKKAGITAKEIIEVKGWQNLSDELRSDLAVSLIDAYGQEGIAAIKSQVPNINASTIVKTVNWSNVSDEARNNLLTQITVAYGKNGIDALKKQFPKIKASDLCQVTDWSQFTTDQKLNFLTALTKAFGSQEAVNAAKEAGLDIGDLVTQGMASKNPEIRNAAKQWNKEINGGLNEETPTTKIDIEIKPGELGSVKQEIEALNAEVNVNLSASGLDEFGKSVKQTIKTAFGSVRFKFQDSNGNLVAAYSIVPYAQGGIVDSGDIFLANENGNPELIGKFGRQTAVANTDQMVEAMARGVQYANESQNALLREQNSLLRSILAKESSVQLVASSALGRTVKQSVNMYNSLYGG